MLFNSPVFIFLFLPLVLLGFHWLGRHGREPALAWLVLASLFFYGWWNPAYLGLIVGSMLFNFSFGNGVDRLRRAGRARVARLALATGIAANLAVLGYFKYFNFFVDTANVVFDAGFNFETIILPLAISFFTFQQITFLVDAYRGEARDYSFLHYALFVVFFPQLIAGPIVHHAEMMPQFLRRERGGLRSADLAIGASIFLLGLFKKVVLADGVAGYATPVFDAAAGGAHLTLVEAWGGVLAYSFQLYFDFSGYSDMAIGLARLFGIVLPLNFASPYKATSIIDFWRRWHMTLSRFLRDYVYIPLGGSRRGRVRRHTNLMITMLLGGLWHGAGWTFVIWGGLHGLYLMINHAWRTLTAGDAPLALAGRLLPRWGAVLLTFASVVVAWAYFRAADFATANSLLAGMAGLHGVLLPADYRGYLGPVGDWLAALGWRFETDPGQFRGAAQLAWLLLCGLIAFTLPNTQQVFGDHGPGLDYRPQVRPRWQAVLQWSPSLLPALVVALLGLVALLSLTRVSEFLYFQF